MSNFALADLRVLPRSSWSVFQYIPYQRIRLFAELCDFFIIVAASLTTGIVYHSLIFAMEGEVLTYLGVGIYSAFVFVVIYRALGLYDPSKLLSVVAQIRGIVLAWGAVLLCITSVFFLLKTGSHFSRGATISFGIVGVGTLLGAHAFIGANLRRALANGTLAGRRVIVIGDREQLSAKSSLDLLRAYGTREVGRFELSPGSDPDCSNERDTTAIDAAIAAAQTQRAEQILLAIGWADCRQRDLICKQLRVLALPVMLLPDNSISSVVDLSPDGPVVLGAIEIQRGPLGPRDLVLKRIFDVILASLGLLLLSPLLAVISAAIKFDSQGPVIFRQRRKGFNGREFWIYKFRTMNCLEDGLCIKQAQRYDHRVTRLGRLLRVSSIDELPQLINVLFGDMSLVGPRPHALAHDDEYSTAIDNYAYRHHVKPGITGWAQTHGFRGETADVRSMHERIKLDLWYINHWSFWLDIRIVALTCVELLRARNAY